jgi:pimeloyl-ACP methyl ester carboxylesterase
MDPKVYATLTNAHYLVDGPDRDRAKRKISKAIADTGFELVTLHRGVARFRNADGYNIVSVKGTNPRDVRDLYSDIKLGVGVSQSDTQFRRRREQVKDIYKQIGDEKVDLTGHSLGGSIVTSMMAESGSIRDKTNKAVLFNSGYTQAFHKELTKDMSKKVRQELRDKVQQNRTSTDFISSGLKLGSIGTVVETKTDIGSHSVTNFLD